MRDIDMSTAAYHRVRLNIEVGLSKKFYGILYFVCIESFFIYQVCVFLALVNLQQRQGASFSMLPFLVMVQSS